MPVARHCHHAGLQRHPIGRAVVVVPIHQRLDTGDSGSVGDWLRIGLLLLGEHPDGLFRSSYSNPGNFRETTMRNAAEHGDDHPELIRWTCPSCGLKVRMPVDHGPVNCSCMQQPIQTPEAIKTRLAICRDCDHYRQPRKSAICLKLGGCPNTLARAQLAGECPEGSWPV